MCKNINKTLTKCIEDGILRKSETGIYELYEEGMEIWCAFDRDRGANGISIQEGDVEFNSAMVIAQNTPINIAWSNDSFDLWILLHLSDVVDHIEQAKDRKYYYNKLTEYFRNHSNSNELLQRTLIHPTFSYERDLKQEKKIKQIVLPEISSAILTAIERAKKLFILHEKENDYSKKSPCTTVFKLVERLLEVGKKTINDSD